VLKRAGGVGGGGSLLGHRDLDRRASPAPRQADQNEIAAEYGEALRPPRPELLNEARGWARGHASDLQDRKVFFASSISTADPRPDDLPACATSSRGPRLIAAPSVT